MNLFRKKNHKRLYGVWQGIKTRCLNQESSSYQYYGGRGIKIDAAWVHDFDAFAKWAVSNGWTEGPRGENSIDRIDNNGDYTPKNCRIANRLTQERNKSTTRYASLGSETKCISEWAADPRCVVPLHTIFSRLRRGWQFEDILLSPSSKKESIITHPIDGRKMSVAAWARQPECLVAYATLYYRLKNGWSFVEAISTPNQKPGTKWQKQ